MLRFRFLGASFSRSGCFVLWSSFSSASFSKLPRKVPRYSHFAVNIKTETKGLRVREENLGKYEP